MALERSRAGLFGWRPSEVSAWRPGEGPLPPRTWTGRGRPPRLMQRSKDHKPLSAKALAVSLPAEAWKTIT
ncbi:hypothetical protein EWE75_17015 [Sphingomonas populi]|uniref:Transposase IS701-like DDE domain-containing protein n=1 Tax=Sphingomonas populi TaxID=2484750 RepID=A0A4Q6Y224_9SPHN|nr:hypothetical protein EWE75_17015 [Sphingomonas populi]